MYTKKIQIFILFLIILSLISFISAIDPQIDIPVLGDNQMTIRSFGDAQLYVTGSAGNATVGVAPPTNNTIIITTPGPPTAGGGGGGGGGGGAALGPTSMFTLNPDSLKAFLRQGEIVTQEFTITNNGPQPITINITSGKLGDLIRLSDNLITLNPGETRRISVDFIARDDTPPDLYMGHILFESGGTVQSLSVALEIETKNPLLDVAVTIPFQYQEVSPGQDMLAQFTLYNLGSTFGDVFLEYIMRDDNGNTILNQTDAIAIQTQTSFVKTFKVPSDALLGHYMLYVRADYSGKTASASAGFNIVNVSTRDKIYIITIFSLVIIIAGFIGFIILRRVNKNYKPVKRVDIEDLLWR